VHGILIKGVKTMKKILLAIAILVTSAGSGVWAQSTQGKEKPQWVLDLEKNHWMHPKKTKPQRKISGAAVRGAKQVSPLVLPKNK
jgi:hypothetical protein